MKIRLGLGLMIGMVGLLFSWTYAVPGCGSAQGGSYTSSSSISVNSLCSVYNPVEFPKSDHGSSCEDMGTDIIVSSQIYSDATQFKRYCQNTQSNGSCLDGVEYPTTLCTANKIVPQNGVCGAAIGSYTSTETTFRSPFCSVGSPTPSIPSFPAAGSSTSRTCGGLNGGNPSSSCTAVRAATPGGTANCSIADGIVAHTASQNVYNINDNSCGSLPVVCNNGQLTVSGYPVVGTAYQGLYLSSTACQAALAAQVNANINTANLTGYQCGIAAAGSSSSYPNGLYTNQRNTLYTSSGTIPLFCSTGTIVSAPSAAASVVSRTCPGSGSSTLSCSNTVRSNQPTACGVSSSASVSSLTYTTPGVCIAGSGHSDTSILGNISVLSLGGGNTSPWTWTCGGTYHDTTSCSAISQGLCGSAGSGGTQSFLSLNSTSTGLCDNGSASAFVVQPISSSPLYTARYNWNCVGSQPTAYQACTALQTPTPTPGICNAGINGQSLTYTQFTPSLLCTQGVPSQTVFSASPNSGTQWTRTCLGLGQAANASCSVNAITDGACTSYSTPQVSQPTDLCASGRATAVSVSNGSYVWLCNGTNGGISSQLCQASCLNGQCNLTSTGSTASGSTSTGSTTTTTTVGNGQTTPISLNQVCTDPDGCACYNVTIVRGSTCLSNNLTGTTDSIRTPIDIGESCLDADGCICNGGNNIVNGSVCQTDGLTGMLPGLADLIVSQAVTSGTIARRGVIEVTISYYNRGQDTATGAKIEYYLSPLISRFRTSAPYTLSQVSSSGYIESSEYQNNILVFPIGDVKKDENGQIKIQLTLNATLTDTELSNSTSIASRLRDPKPLDNAQKLILGLDTQQATTLGVTLVNPFLGIQNMIKQYETMNNWLRIDPVFDDIQRGDDDYMPIMTVVRNGIFEGYRYKFKRSFGADKCTSRIEAINVIAKTLYTAGSTDVYVSRQKGTAFVDMAGISSQSQTFVNRAYERGLLKILKPKSIKGSLYLEPNNTVLQSQVKEMIFLIYQRYGLDPTIVEPLLTEENNCVTRGDLAYVITQILRGNPNIMMGYNDEFLKQLITRTSKLTIAQRRTEFQKVVDKLKTTEPSVLFANGYDGESLIGILEAAMAGRIYNPVVDVSSTSNFLYQKRE